MLCKFLLFRVKQELDRKFDTCVSEVMWSLNGELGPYYEAPSYELFELFREARKLEMDVELLLLY